VQHSLTLHRRQAPTVPSLSCALKPPAAGLSDTFDNCPTVFRFYWFAWAFTTVVLISIGVAAATRLGLHYARAFLVGLITVCLFLNMVMGEAFVGYEQTYNPRSFWWMPRWRAVVAGAIINTVALIGLLVAVGIE
jgi:hypothetical protein